MVVNWLKITGIEAVVGTSTRQNRHSAVRIMRSATG